MYLPGMSDTGTALGPHLLLLLPLAGTAPGSGYLMLLGSGVQGVGGALLLYRSESLLEGTHCACCDLDC